MMSTCIRKILLGLVIVLLAASPAVAQIKKSDSVVKAKATASKPDADGNQTVTITLDVEKPWHLYANPVANDMLTGAQTLVKFTTKVEDIKLTYPPGTVAKDKEIGDYKIYEGKVTITAQVKRVKEDAGPLALTVKLQACDKNSCLLQSTIKLTAE